MTTDELLAKYNPVCYPFSLPKQPLPCCYFLCSEKEVKYVGQTIRLPARLGDHSMTKPPFDEVFYIPTPVRKLTKVEGKLIYEITPPWNGGVEKKATSLNFAEIKKLGVGEVDVMGLLARQGTRKRDTADEEIYRLRSALSSAQDLLYNAMRKDSFALVDNVCCLIGNALSGQTQSRRIVNGR